MAKPFSILKEQLYRDHPDAPEKVAALKQAIETGLEPDKPVRRRSGSDRRCCLRLPSDSPDDR